MFSEVEHITDERVKEVMLRVDRADFCPTNPYQDFPQQIGYNATISAPHMHALALELLKDHLRDGNTVLDIGSGSGYLTVCMALMVGRRGRVVGIDHFKELVDLSITNISKHHSDLLMDGRITMITGDGRNGYRAGAPYTAIHVGAAAPKLPDTLVDQLAPGGRMIIPVGEAFSDQYIVQVDKDMNGTKIKQHFGTYFLKRSMAWRSHGESNASLVENLRRNGLFKDERVKMTMLRVDRADFCPRNPYLDNPEPIGCNATISAPHMHAAALERLKDHLTEGDRALDIGSGSGYLTTCMAYMVGASGKVIGVEHIKQLVDLSISNIRKNHANLLEGRVLMVEGDGRKGFSQYAPYKAIHVGAAAPNVPDELLNQLAPGGRMLIPVGAAHSDQRFLQVDKDGKGKITVNDLMGVIYVPLTNKENQIGRNQ
uniref:Protein-L-isoaspartate(D-aspartate) O-methyltransferase n=1 Tax=Elaeophora elaphi TaxID=1147741 RepID=A0A0R3RQE1_9BILA